MTELTPKAAAEARVRDELLVVVRMALAVIENPCGWPVCVNDVANEADELCAALRAYVNAVNKAQTGDTT